jgi:hypothetical protein
MRTPRLTKHTILFLAANPLGTDRLALDREARAIQEELERGSDRDRFELVTRWAVQPLDLLRELRKLRPTIVHFSGHGGRHGGRGEFPAIAALRRDVIGEVISATEPGNTGGDDQHGLFLEGQDGRPHFVSSVALKGTFGALRTPVKLVVLNACYSDAQAAALLTHTGCVVGMRGSIGDDAARSFATAFYGALCDRESLATAYQQGCAAISLMGLPEWNRPQLMVRDGVNADHLVLASASGRIGTVLVSSAVVAMLTISFTLWGTNHSRIQPKPLSALRCKPGSVQTQSSMTNKWSYGGYCEGHQPTVEQIQAFAADDVLLHPKMCIPFSWDETNCCCILE